jgi:hypothetical protein
MEPIWRTCPFCSTSLASLNESPKNHRTHNNSHQEATIVAVGEDDEDSNYLDHINKFTPRIDGLLVEFQKPQLKESLSNLINNPMAPPPPIIPNPNVPQRSKEEILREFKQEAGTPAQRLNNEVNG